MPTRSTNCGNNSKARDSAAYRQTGCRRRRQSCWHRSSLLPVSDGEIAPRRPLGVWILTLALLASPLIHAAALLLGVIIYVATGKGTLKIELSDPSANVEVKIDGNQIDGNNGKGVLANGGATTLRRARSPGNAETSFLRNRVAWSRTRRVNRSESQKWIANTVRASADVSCQVPPGGTAGAPVFPDFDLAGRISAGVSDGRCYKEMVLFLRRWPLG